MRTQAEIERLLVDAALVLKAGATDAPKELTGMAVALACRISSRTSARSATL
jgi:hypothetical protein